MEKVRNVFVGRRKTAVARVYFKDGNGKIVVNNKPFEEYFKVLRLQKLITEPLELADIRNKYDVYVNVSGGGITGQAGAIRLGIARTIVQRFSDEHKKLKDAGMLTRDPRMVERKKYGKHKARRSTQFSKR